MKKLLLFATALALTILFIITPVYAESHLVWSKYYGGSSERDLYPARIDRYNTNYINNYYIVCGMNSYASKGFIYKLDGGGDELWSLLYGEDTYFLSCKFTSTGDIIAVGYKLIESSPNGLIVKFDGNGNEIWNKTIPYAYEFRDVALDSNDNIYLAGKHQEDYTPSWIVYKLDADGTEIWSVTQGTNTIARSIVVDANGYPIAAGEDLDSNYGMIQKYAPSDGYIIWAQYNYTAGSGYSVIERYGEYIYLAQEHGPDGIPYIEKRYASDGSQIWAIEANTIYNYGLIVNNFTVISLGGENYGELWINYVDGTYYLDESWDLSGDYNYFQDGVFSIGYSSFVVIGQAYDESNTYGAFWIAKLSIDYPPRYTISGYVKDGYGNPIAEAYVCDIPNIIDDAITDDDGYYELQSYDAYYNGSYTIKAMKGSLSDSQIVEISGANLINVNFTLGGGGSYPPYTVSGYVRDERGYPIAGAFVWDSSNDSISWVTDNNGFYKMEDHFENGTYYIYAAKYGYLSSGQLITIAGEDKNVNFVLYNTTPSITPQPGQKQSYEYKSPDIQEIRLVNLSNKYTYTAPEGWIIQSVAVFMPIDPGVSGFVKTDTYNVSFSALLAWFTTDVTISFNNTTAQLDGDERHIGVALEGLLWINRPLAETHDWDTKTVNFYERDGYDGIVSFEGRNAWRIFSYGNAINKLMSENGMFVPPAKTLQFEATRPCYVLVHIIKIEDLQGLPKPTWYDHLKSAIQRIPFIGPLAGFLLQLFYWIGIAIVYFFTFLRIVIFDFPLVLITFETFAIAISIATTTTTTGLFLKWIELNVRFFLVFINLISWLIKVFADIARSLRSMFQA